MQNQDVLDAQATEVVDPTDLDAALESLEAAVEDGDVDPDADDEIIADC